MSGTDADVHIDVENGALRRPLQAMAALVQAHGGFIAPGLRIVERNRFLSIHRPRSAGPVPRLIAVPTHLLVPIDDLAWSDSASKLALAGPAGHLSSEQAELLELFVAIYNACGKLAQVADFPVAVFARDAGLLEIVRTIKPETRPLKASLADLFLSTRRVSERIKPGDETRTGVLMPLMDFLNHHHAGDTFRMDEGCLSIAERHAGPGEECVSSYGGQRDPFDLLIGHGYVDRATPYAASLPLTLGLPGLGSMIIEGLNLGANHAVNPPRVSFAPGEVRLSHLVFDRRAPAPVLSALSLPVRALGKRANAPDTAVERALAELPARLLEANRAALRHFRAALAMHGRSPDLVAGLLAASEVHEANLAAALG